MSIKKAFLYTLLAEVAIGALAIFNYGLTVEALQAVTRFSGRLSLVIFSLIFLFHRSKTNITERLSSSYFLIFAFAHGIHLIELLSYVYLSGIPLVPHRLAGGFLAYVLIFIMPWFQWRYEKGKLSEKRFTAIGLVYIYYVWFIFFMTYLARVQGTFPNAGGSYAEHVTLLAWVSLMLGMKVQGFVFQRKA
jgi:hypothetical protein